MGFTEDLHAVAGAALPADVPSPNDVPALVGSLIKVLEHADIKVAEELLPKPAADVVAPEVVAAEPALEGKSEAELEQIVANAQEALAKFTDDSPASAEPAAASPPAPPPSPEPPAA